VLLGEQAQRRRKQLEAAADARSAQERVAATERKLRAAQDDTDRVERRLDEVLSDRAMLEADRARTSAALERELSAAVATRDRTAASLRDHEEEAFQSSQFAEGLERAMTRDRFGARAADAKEQEEAQRSAGVAARRSERERALVRARERRQREVAAAVTEAETAAAAEAATRLVSAAEGSRRATARVAGILRAVEPAERRAGELEREAREARTSSLLQLRRSLMAVEKDARSSAAAVRGKRARKAEAEAAEFDELLTSGQNPYAVFRRRERLAKEAVLAREAEEAVERHRLELTDAIVVEDAAQRRRDALARTRQAEAEALAGARRPGAGAGAYLASKTRGGADVLDPTGRAARIDASAVTAMRTHAFGTGRVAMERPDVLLRERRRPEMRGVQADEKWLPRRVPHPDEDEDEDAEGPGGGGGRGAQADGAAGGRASASTATATAAVRNARGLAELSPLEQRLMAQATERIRSGRAQKQVVLGREFRGRSMVPAPSAIEFRDFEPGQEHRCRVTLTNGSLSFVSLRLLPLPDGIADMFDVVFKPPGRMSAGTSVPVTVVFHPPASLAEAVEAELVVDTSTGPCPVPLLCSPKRALPFAPSPVCSLGQVVRGETVAGSVELRNSGALPVAWAVEDCGPDKDDGAGGGAAGLGERGADGLCAVGDGVWSVRGSGRLAGYGSSKLPVRCDPGRGTALGRSSRRLRVVFRVIVDGDGNDGGPGADALSGPMLGTLGRTAAVAAAKRSAPTVDQTEKEEQAEARASAAAAVARRRRVMTVEPVELVLSADVRPLALFVQPDSADLRVCECPLPPGTPGLATPPDGPEAVFRATVCLRNRGTTAIRASLSVPEPLRRWIEARPPSCYVQAPEHDGDPGLFRVSVRLTPTVDMLRDEACRPFFAAGAADVPPERAAWASRVLPPDVVASGSRPGSFCELKVPITVRGAGQTLPVRFVLRAAICMRGLRVEPAELDAGRVPIGVSACLPVRLTNLSALPVRYGPAGKPPLCVRVAQGAGLGVILPGATAEADVVFAPDAAEQASGRVAVQTSSGERHSLPFRGEGVRALAALSASRVCLPATSPGEAVETAVAVTSTAAGDVEVHVVGGGRAASLLPRGLTASPAVFKLRPGERRLVRLSFCPDSLPEAGSPRLPASARSATVDEPEGAGSDEEGKAASDGEDAGADEAADAADDEPAAGARSADSRVPELPRAAGQPRPGQSSAVDPGVVESRVWVAVRAAGGAAGTAAAGGAQLLALDVQTAVTAARLGVSARVLRFGDVPAGRRVVGSLKVECTGALPVTLEATGLNPAGAFRVVNAPRCIRPGRSATLSVEFHPESRRVCTDQLRLRAKEGGGAIVVRLAGTGATPDVALRGPAGGGTVPTVSIDLGDVVVGDEAAASAALVNASMFAMRFVAETAPHVASGAAASAVSARGGFAVSPAAGEVGPASAAPLSVSFRSDAASLGAWWSWSWTMRVPNYEGPPLVVTARARSWAGQGFVVELGSSAPRRRLDRLDGALRGQSRLPGAGPAAAEPARVELSVDATADPSSDAARASFGVGCCRRPDGAPSAPVAFRLEIDADAAGADLLVAEPSSGTAQPGDVVPVVVSASEAAAAEGDDVKALAALVPASRPARSLTVPIKVHLTGPDERTEIVRVRVRAF